jgi:8-oxo-dGTP diphosphatase
VGAIIFQEGKVLLAERGKEPLKGWWSLPGGLVETGETLHQAIRREVREETGLEITPGPVFEVFERIMRDAAGAAEYHYVLVDYICPVTGGDLRPGDDVSRVEWVAEADLEQYRITEGTVEVIARAFRVESSPR